MIIPFWKLWAVHRPPLGQKSFSIARRSDVNPVKLFDDQIG